MSKPITASQFKNKATRLVEIPGFEEGEQIQVLIKSASVMNMLVNGKLPNELMSVVDGLFKSEKTELQTGQELLKDPSALSAITDMLSKVCEEVMIEPAYADVEQYMTDEQKQAIFNKATGNVKQAIPSLQE